MTDQPPAQLRIGHLTYDVLEDQALVDSHSARHGGGSEYAGWSQESTQTIALATRGDGDRPIGEQYRRETLLHEVLHQCLRVTNTNPDQDAAAGSKEIEERTVCAMAGALLAVLRDNPELVRHLTS